jgi:hypothetical protein
MSDETIETMRMLVEAQLEAHARGDLDAMMKRSRGIGAGRVLDGKAR